MIMGKIFPSSSADGISLINGIEPRVKTTLLLCNNSPPTSSTSLFEGIRSQGLAEKKRLRTEKMTKIATIIGVRQVEMKSITLMTF